MIRNSKQSFFADILTNSKNSKRSFQCPDPGCNKAFVNCPLMTVFYLLPCCRWAAFPLSRPRLQQGVCSQRGTDTSSQNPLRRASLRMWHVRQSLHAQGPPQQARALAPRTSHERWRANGARVNFVLVLPALSWVWKRHCSAELSWSFDRFHVRESALSVSLLKVLAPEPFRPRTYVYICRSVVSAVSFEPQAVGLKVAAATRYSRIWLVKAKRRPTFLTMLLESYHPLWSL